jgi:hypothetical protein
MVRLVEDKIWRGEGSKTLGETALSKIYVDGDWRRRRYGETGKGESRKRLVEEKICMWKGRQGSRDW